MLILGIETSGKTASCAVYDSEKKSVRGEFTVKTEKMQSQIILPMCEKLLEETELELSDIDSFAVSKGPGSYTGIRIGSLQYNQSKTKSCLLCCLQESSWKMRRNIL